MAKQLERDTGGCASEECEDTIDLELGAEQILALSRAEAEIRADSPPTPSKPPVLSAQGAVSRASQSQDDVGSWPAIILNISLATALSGAIAYLATSPLATSPAQPVAVTAKAIAHRAADGIVAAPVQDAAADNPPVRYTNPFDTSEVFEFPSGTSETEAQQAVADLLLQRARDREKTGPRISYRRKTADQVAPIKTSSLAQRG